MKRAPLVPLPFNVSVIPEAKVSEAAGSTQKVTAEDPHGVRGCHPRCASSQRPPHPQGADDVTARTRPSKVLHRRRLVIAVAGAALTLLAACGGGSGGTKPTSANGAGGSASSKGASTTAPVQVTTTVKSAASPGSGTPSRKPCDLLTKKIAEDALGVQVGGPKDFPGQGNETCGYTTADGVGQVLLTTYGAKGTAVALDQAAKAFTNAYAVEGVGDAARVSLEDHAIGVLRGDFVFGMALMLPGPDQNITPVTEAQLVKLANALLAEL